MGICDISKVDPKNKNYACFPMGAVKKTERENDITCGMFADINGRLAYIYGPSKKICYLPCGYDKMKNDYFIQLNFDNPKIPPEFWSQISSNLQDKHLRIKELEKRMRQTYKGLNNAKIIDLITAPLVVVERDSKDKEYENKEDEYINLTKRSFKNNIVGKDGTSEHIFLEKGTYSCLNALHSLKNTLNMEVKKVNMKKEQANKIFSNFCSQDINEKDIKPITINPEAFLNKEQKFNYSQEMQNPNYQEQLLLLSKEHFGKNVGEKLVSHIIEKKSPINSQVTKQLSNIVSTTSSNSLLAYP